MAVHIRRAGVDDLELVRETRLRSLADSPDAFWTTWAEAEAEPREVWSERLGAADRATFIGVREAGLTLGGGLVFGAPHHDLPGQAGLYGMWVAPELRRGGLAGSLIHAVIDWARAAGYPRLLLEVGDANASAIATYTALGFAPTGRRGAMPAPRDHITEHELALDL